MLQALQVFLSKCFPQPKSKIPVPVVYLTRKQIIESGRGASISKYKSR